MMERRSVRFLAFTAFCFLILAISEHAASGQDPVSNPATTAEQGTSGQDPGSDSVPPAEEAGTGVTDSVTNEAPSDEADTTGVSDPVTTSEDDANAETSSVSDVGDGSTTDTTSTDALADDAAATGAETGGDVGTVSDTETGADTTLTEGDAASLPDDPDSNPVSGSDTADSAGDGTFPGQAADITTVDDTSESGDQTTGFVIDPSLDEGEETADPVTETGLDDTGDTADPVTDTALDEGEDTADPTAISTADDSEETTDPTTDTTLDDETDTADLADDTTSDGGAETSDAADDGALGGDTDTTSDTTEDTDTDSTQLGEDSDEVVTSTDGGEVISQEDEDTTDSGEDTTETEEETTETEGDTDTDSEIDTADETGTEGEVVPDTTSTTDTVQDEQLLHEQTEKADFVVYDKFDQPCLLASLNITIHFKYLVQEGLIRETYDTVSKKSVEDDSSYEGTCEENTSKLSIRWNNDTFTLNLTFIVQETEESSQSSEDELQMDVLPPGVNYSSYWALQQVSLSYDTSNEAIFPEASNPSVESVSAEKLQLFKTPMGLSYMCQTPEAVGIEFKDVDLVFNFIHLLPFKADSKFFTNATVECSGDLSSVPAEDDAHTVPFIVAGCLAAAVVVIIVGYAGHRCVTKRVRQAEYKQMP